MNEKRKTPGYGAQLKFADADFEVHEASCHDFTFPKHVHEEYTVGLVRSGEEVIYCRGVNHQAGTGQLYFINPDEAHAAAPVARGGWSYTSIYFHSRLLNRVFADGGRRAPVPRFTTVLNEQPPLAGLFRHATAILKTSKCAMEREATLHSLIADCFARNGEGIEGTAARTEKGRDSGKLEQAKRYLRDNLGEAVSLQDVASYIGWHPGYLVAAFKRAEGLTPHLYLVAQRLNAARSGLKTGKNTSEIAVECGFYDQSHLNRHFRRAFGMTPGQFRQRATRGAVNR